MTDQLRFGHEYTPWEHGSTNMTDAPDRFVCSRCGLSGYNEDTECPVRLRAEVDRLQGMLDELAAQCQRPYYHPHAQEHLVCRLPDGHAPDERGCDSGRERCVRFYAWCSPGCPGGDECARSGGAIDTDVGGTASRRRNHE